MRNDGFWLFALDVWQLSLNFGLILIRVIRDYNWRKRRIQRARFGIPNRAC